MDIASIAENIVRYRHRRLFVVTGKGTEPAEKAAQLLLEMKNFIDINNVLYIAEFPKDKKDDEERYSKFVSIFGEVERLPYAKSKEVLGKTYDALVLDAFNNFPARDIGITVETVRGPGIIIFLMPPLEEWVNKKLFFHGQYVVTPPYTVYDCGNIYQRRIVKKFSLPGIYIIGDKIVGKEPRIRTKKRKRIKIPKKAILPEKIYRLALTQDQVDIINALENVLQEDKAYVILADRGRGKSAVLGLFLAGLGAILDEKKRVIVTAPVRSNVDELFKFLKRGAEVLGLKHSKKRVGKLKINYREPLDAIKERADLMVVDEAAGIYVSILRELLDNAPSFIFSTTSHGYEGTGRLFQYRFLPLLEEKFDVTLLRMEEPIRYGENDPVERWLYETFLLDAEPAKIAKTDKELVKQGKLLFKKEDRESLFLREEKKLKEFIGIYVFAHYRNNPRDIAILADAPNQNAFSVSVGDKVVASLQVAEEGGLTEEYINRMLEGEIVFGNIIPDIFLKYYGLKDFARKKGLRIVRIATHPDLQGMGIGSFGLKKLEEYAVENGYSWTGAGFGASYRVVRFWKKNGYIMVHVSPKRNPESGEYSTIFVKPLEDGVEKAIRMANFSAKTRLITELDNYYYYMDPEVALELLSSGPRRSISLDLSEGEIRRLHRYVNGYLFYDAVSDVVLKLIRWYFLSGAGPSLPQSDKMYLIEKILKKKTWKESAKVFGLEPSKFAKRVDKIIYKIGKYVLEEII